MITSVCGKHAQHVTGDGVRTLKELIIDDDRAVLMAGFYFKKFAGQLSEIPGIQFWSLRCEGSFDR